MNGRSVQFKWTLGFTDEADGIPETMFPASVPGAVQKDYGAFMGFDPFYKGTEFKKFAFCEDKFWHYKAKLCFTAAENETAYLCFDGADYSCSVKIDSETVYKHTGMFSPFHIEVTKYSGLECDLEVVFDPVPKCGRTNDRNEARKSCKSDACYGWDWHPRLITSGLWGDVYLELKNKQSFDSVDMSYRLSDDLKRAGITLDCKFGCVFDGLLSVRLSENGKECAEYIFPVSGSEKQYEMSFDTPKLWYPTGYGKQNTYVLTAVLTDKNGIEKDRYEKKIGFRRSKLIMNKGSWDKPDSFPKSRSDAPAQLEINGIKVFAKGSNWVNAEVFPCDMTDEKYRELLLLVKNANMNILRIWGGGFINRESFFDMCDELGIMIWQEFPLACNEYPDDDGYLSVLHSEAVSIVRRLRTHPSVVLWCGGNELFNSWSGMTDQNHALRLLNAVCYGEDRFTPFIATSPLMGMSHGHYTSYDAAEKKETLQLFREAHSTAYTEFGTPSLASEKVLRLFADENDFDDFTPENDVWREHHAFGAWLDGSWTDYDAIIHFFGKTGDLRDTIAKSRFIQAMNYRACFEEMRRQSPHCAMAINWCFNEPWPTAANNSIVSWENEPKPSYYAVCDALRPQAASLETEKLLWFSGEMFRGRVWILNDSLNVLHGGEVTVSSEINGKTYKCGTFDFGNVMPQTNIEIGAVSLMLPDDAAGLINVKISVVDRPKLSSEYSFPCRDIKKAKETKPAVLNF